MFTYSPKNGSLVALFQGFSSAEGKTKPTTILKGDSGKANASSEIGVKITASSFELREALGLSREVGVGMDGLGDVSQATEFYQSLNVTETTLCVIAYAKRLVSTDFVKEARLQEGIRAPSTDAEIDEFVAIYGDTFVSEVTKGGQYWAVFKFQCKSVEQMVALKNNLAAQGVVDGVQVKASITSSLSIASSNLNMTYEFTQKMIGVEAEAYPTQDEAITFVLGFINSKNVKIDGICAFKLTSFYEIPGLTESFKNIKHNQDLLYGSGTSNQFFDCAMYKHNQLSSLVESIKLIKKTYAYLSVKPEEVFMVKSAEAEKDYLNIMNVFEGYVRSPSQVITLPNTPSLNYGIPCLQLENNVSAAIGGDGGIPFSDMQALRDFDVVGLPSLIGIDSGKYIDCISTEYKSSKNSRLMISHGRKGADKYTALEIRSGEYISSIKGQGGVYVDYLEYTLNTGYKITAGTYKDNLTLKTLFESKDNFQFYGYVGRAQSWIDQLQVISIRPKAVNWVQPD